MANTGERQPLLDQKIDPRTDITAEGKARDELLDRHTTCVILFFFFREGVFKPLASLQMGIRRSTGCDGHDDGVSPSHVLPLDLLLVL
jgi:hypothetical protein